MKQVRFIAKTEAGHPRDGEAGWIVMVDGKTLIEVDNDELDIGDNALNPLWKALDVEIKFDFDEG